MMEFLIDYNIIVPILFCLSLLISGLGFADVVSGGKISIQIDYKMRCFKFKYHEWRGNTKKNGLENKD